MSIFFMSYLAFSLSTLDHLQEDSLTIMMLITLQVCLLNPKVTRNLELRFGTKAQFSASVGFDSFKKFSDNLEI